MSIFRVVSWDKSDRLQLSVGVLSLLVWVIDRI